MSEHPDHYPPRLIAMLEAVWGDGFLSPGGPDEVARVIGSHNLTGLSVLDIGCGSGQPIARHLLERGFCVVGVDSSPTLIATCRRRFPEAQWMLADMRTLSINRTFDGLIAWDSFFHLRHDDQRLMFRVVEEDHPHLAVAIEAGPNLPKPAAERTAQRKPHGKADLDPLKVITEDRAIRLIEGA